MSVAQDPPDPPPGQVEPSETQSNVNGSFDAAAEREREMREKKSPEADGSKAAAGEPKPSEPKTAAGTNGTKHEPDGSFGADVADSERLELRVLAFAAFDEEGAALSRSLTREHFTGARAGLLFTIVHEWYRVNQAPMEPAILESRWIEAGRSAMEATELDSALHSAWTNVAGQDVPKIVKELARSVRRRKYNSLLVQARIALTPPLREPLKALSLIEQANKVANDNAAGSDAAALITLHGAESIFKPLPEMKWISSELMLGLGRPALVAAYGGTGKTLLLQALALCVAAGNSIWNKYAIAAPLSVVHLDYEQGSWATYRRYQRLALGYGISPAEIGDRLQVASHPPLYLTSKKAADELQRISEGRHLVIIDSLRAAAPGVDENDSKVREYLDLLSRLSESTGTAFIVVHHAGKNGDAQADARHLARGSSSIFDACGCVYVVKRPQKKGEPLEVVMAKSPASAEGQALEDFGLSIVDVVGEERPVRLEWSALDPMRNSSGDGSNAKDEADAKTILWFVARHPGATANDVVKGANVRRKDCLKLLKKLETDGRVRVVKDGQAFLHFAVADFTERGDAD